MATRQRWSAAARRRGHLGRQRRAWRLRRAHRLRSLQDLDRHGRGDDRGPGVGRARACGSGPGQGDVDAGVRVDLAAVNQRVLELAGTQSCDIAERLQRENVELWSAAAGWTDRNG